MNKPKDDTQHDTQNTSPEQPQRGPGPFSGAREGLPLGSEGEGSEHALNANSETRKNDPRLAHVCSMRSDDLALRRSADFAEFVQRFRKEEDEEGCHTCGICLDTFDDCRCAEHGYR